MSGADVSTVLVVGASRGIGLEFARQYAQAGAHVMATHRKPEDAAALHALGAQPMALDVTDAASIQALAAQLAQERIDVAVLNAGIYGPRTAHLEAVDQATFDAVMHTNVWGPLQLVCVLAPLFVPTHGKLALISSRMGSTALMNDSTGWLYRASKAAANSVLRAASLELGPRGVVCMALHPGWVKTDLGGAGASMDVATSVSGMRRVIAAANDSHNGKFLNYTGAQFDW